MQGEEKNSVFEVFVGKENGIRGEDVGGSDREDMGRESGETSVVVAYRQLDRWSLQIFPKVFFGRSEQEKR